VCRPKMTYLGHETPCGEVGLKAPSLKIDPDKKKKTLTATFGYVFEIHCGNETITDSRNEPKLRIEEAG